MTQQPLQVWDATFALYRVDVNDAPVGTAIFLGAAAEKARLWGEYAERMVQRHGRQFESVYHENESHFIELENVATVSVAEEQEAAAELRRNERYALVVVWHDEDTEVWRKRTYLGVKAQPPKLGDNNLNQTLRFRAEKLESQTAGRGDMPSLGIARYGEVRYIGTDSITLYTYASDDNRFHAIDEGLLPGRAAIVFEDGVMEISFDGVVAMRASASGVECNSIDATGATFSDDSPRLEFWMGGVRRASLTSAGDLVVAEITEADAAPDAVIPSMKATDANGTGNWIFTLQSGGMTCPEISEVTL